MSLFLNRVTAECDNCGFTEDFDGDTYVADLRDSGWTNVWVAETRPEDRNWLCSECSEEKADNE